jgi:heptosyltransferase I
LKILLVKLSSLGDVVHAMPAVQDILRALPQAQIDWVVETGFAPLVRRCQGVGRVIESDLRRWRKSPLSNATRAAWRAFKADLQHDAYDAVIDLQGLTKSALVSRLARLAPHGKRYALANRTEGSSYEAPSRWVADVAVPIAVHTAAVQRSRDLCARALGYSAPDGESFGLFSHGDIQLFDINNVASSISGKNELRATVDGQRLPAKPAVALVHGTSRADKHWPLAHWQALGMRLNQAGYSVVLPHGSDAEQRTSEAIASRLTSAVVWPRLKLDALTDALARCAGVIGVDSGLSHIAVALDLAHVQIYNFDTAWRTGPQCRARQVCVFAEPWPTLDAVWQAWLRVVAAGKPSTGDVAIALRSPAPAPQ